MWKCEDVEMWKCGNVEMWKCEDVEMWKCEDAGAKRQSRECGMRMWKLFS